MNMRKQLAITFFAATLLALAACGSSAPNQDDVVGCTGLKQTSLPGLRRRALPRRAAS